MPLGKVHRVLCLSCNEEVTTLYAYDEQRCAFTARAARAEGDALSHVSCTNKPGSSSCKSGIHFDKFMQVRFQSCGKLRASQQGQVGRPLGEHCGR